MLKLSKISLHGLLTLCLATLLYVSAPTLAAQAASQEKDDSKGFDFYTEVGFEHSDNVFHLTDSQESKMEANTIEDSQSGRFEDMESVSDNIISPILGMKYDFKGLEGEDLNLTLRVRYNYYMDNKEKSYPEARIRLKNDIGEKGALILEGNFLFDFFKKNYLSGYNNTNGNGNITREERIYSPAIYDEFEGVFSYEYKLINNKKAAISGLDIEPAIGYSTRLYNSPFGNRDKKIISGGMGLLFEFISKIDLEINYLFEKVDSPNFRELILYDEITSGTDANEDNSLYSNAPLVTNIDRSSERNTIGIGSSYKLMKKMELFAEYRKRTTSYNSDNLLDIEHYNQKAYRERIKSGVEYKFSKFLSTALEYSKTSDEDEDGDYTENIYLLKVKLTN